MYFGAAIAILAMSSCFTVAVLNLHHRGDNGDRVPAILRSVVLGCLARMLCMKDLVDNNTKAFVQVSGTEQKACMHICNTLI